MALTEVSLKIAFGEGDSGYIPKYEKSRIGMSLDFFERKGIFENKEPPSGRILSGGCEHYLPKYGWRIEGEFG